ncbi:Uncharacterised protein [Bordetella pertussis]|nr:Uncharacterised protein [Bordetella pertussis]
MCRRLTGRPSSASQSSMPPCVSRGSVDATRTPGAGSSKRVGMPSGRPWTSPQL